MPTAHRAAERLQGREKRMQPWWRPMPSGFRPGWENLTVGEKVLIKESWKGSKTPTGWPSRTGATKARKVHLMGPGKMDAELLAIKL